MLCLSCEQGKSELTDEKLADIIADMHISEIAVQRQVDVDQDSVSQLFLEKLEEIHGVAKEQIKYEVELLMQDRKRQSEVYTIVIDKLQGLEKEMKKLDNPRTAKIN